MYHFDIVVGVREIIDDTSLHLVALSPHHRRCGRSHALPDAAKGVLVIGIEVVVPFAVLVN